MSHFTYMKTLFQNFFYLQKALNRLNIEHQKNYASNSDIVPNFVIPQSNDSNIEFLWNGQEYDLVVDMSYWKQACPMKNFIDKIAQQYAEEVIIGESKKIGFEPIEYQKNFDGSNTLVLERWNSNLEIIKN